MPKFFKLLMNIIKLLQHIEIAETERPKPAAAIGEAPDKVVTITILTNGHFNDRIT